MANNKENNIKWHAALTTFVNSVKDRFALTASSKDLDTGLEKKAEKDLTNVNVGAEKVGKLYSVSTSGGLEFVEPGYTKVQADNRIEYRKDKVEFFATVQTGTKFEDATLFDKQLVPVGDAVLGGVWGTSTKGSTPATTATQAGHKHIDGRGGFSDRNYRYGNMTGATNGAANTAGITSNAEEVYTSTETPAITIHQTVAHNTTGTVDAKGIELVVVAYRAKKNITFAEMGNTGVDSSNGV